MTIKDIYIKAYVSKQANAIVTSPQGIIPYSNVRSMGYNVPKGPVIDMYADSTGTYGPRMPSQSAPGGQPSATNIPNTTNAQPATQPRAAGFVKNTLKMLNPFSKGAMGFSGVVGAGAGAMDLYNSGFGFFRAPENFEEAAEKTQKNIDDIYNSYKSIPDSFRQGIGTGLLDVANKAFSFMGDGVRLAYNSYANLAAQYARDKVQTQRIKDLHKQAKSSNRVNAEMARMELEAFAQGKDWTEEDSLRAQQRLLVKHKRNQIDSQTSSIDNLPDGSKSAHINPHKTRYDSANFYNKQRLDQSKNRVV